MAQDESPNRIVEALQGPGAVVTYRAIIGMFVTIILALVTFIGSSILSSQRELQSTLTQVRIDIGATKGRLDDQSDRLGRVENSVQALSEKSGELDHRVTVIESRGH